MDLATAITDETPDRGHELVHDVGGVGGVGESERGELRRSGEGLKKIDEALGVLRVGLAEGEFRDVGKDPEKLRHARRAYAEAAFEVESPHAAAREPAADVEKEGRGGRALADDGEVFEVVVPCNNLVLVQGETVDIERGFEVKTAQVGEICSRPGGRFNEGVVADDVEGVQLTRLLETSAEIARVPGGGVRLAFDVEVKGGRELDNAVIGVGELNVELDLLERGEDDILLPDRSGNEMDPPVDARDGGRLLCGASRVVNQSEDGVEDLVREGVEGRLRRRGGRGDELRDRVSSRRLLKTGGEGTHWVAGTHDVGGRGREKVVETVTERGRSVLRFSEERRQTHVLRWERRAAEVK